VTLQEVADLIESVDATPVAWGNYLNRRDIRGYYLQTKCSLHWCKVSVSNADRHSERVTIQELESITKEMLDGKLIIPTYSIASALRSKSAEQASLNQYFNNSHVEGMWAEFHHGQSWYMVSVSHIDIPSKAKPEELDRIADELLWQQERMRPIRKRRFRW